ncbi:response regulator transcription factor [Streptomyces sp. NBC_01476]|uniref:response regulator transcription factor n=1 Tax=Streptomyces sp. NBC_01476 TaxID=2903881 RepID=UPI002E36E75B|nr:response regulator transcription factor [Streptomyces sp. NBC_01476]
MIRVLVAHDTSLLRSALAALLGRESDFEVADTEWPRLCETDRALRPQVYVVDADCPGWRRHAGGAAGHGGGTRHRWPQDTGHAGHTGAHGRGVHGRGDQGCACPAAAPASLVVLTGAGKPGDLRRAFEARALGFVNKDRSADRLPTAVRQAAQGKRFVDDSLAVEFLQAADMPLTRRELSVLSLSAEGASVTEIARSLHLCNGTVRNYLAAITRKTGARNRVDAIRISQVAGWV